MIKVRDLMFGSLGNGISVCDRNHEVGGDYEKVAHISPARKITFYVELSESDKQNSTPKFPKNLQNVSLWAGIIQP